MVLEHLDTHFKQNAEWDSSTNQECFDYKLQTPLTLA